MIEESVTKAWIEKYAVRILTGALLAAGGTVTGLVAGDKTDAHSLNAEAIRVNAAAITRINTTLEDLLQESEIANNLMCRRFADPSTGVMPGDCQVLFDARRARERRR